MSRFENDRTISFIPPDGEFELMSYRMMTVVKPLIWIETVVEKFSHSRVEYMIKVFCFFLYKKNKKLRLNHNLNVVQLQTT